VEHLPSNTLSSYGLEPRYVLHSKANTIQGVTCIHSVRKRYIHLLPIYHDLFHCEDFLYNITRNNLACPYLRELRSTAVSAGRVPSMTHTPITEVIPATSSTFRVTNIFSSVC